MFSPAGSRSKARDRDGAASARGRLRHAEGRSSYGGEDALPSSPSTPLQLQQLSSYQHASAGFMGSSPSRRLANSTVRSPSLLKSADKAKTDNSQPVFVRDLPQQLRMAQSEEMLHIRSDGCRACGGMDQNTGLSWMIQDTEVFVWSHVSSQSSESVKILTIPHQLHTLDHGTNDGHSWAASIVRLQNRTQTSYMKFTEKCNSASFILCSRKSLAIVYWPNIFTEAGSVPVVSLPSEESAESRVVRRTSLGWSGVTRASHIRSIVASPYVGGDVEGCVVIACQSSGELWRFDCCRAGVTRSQIQREVDTGPSQGEMGQSFFITNSSAARTVAWHNGEGLSREGCRQLLLLTATVLECWDIELRPCCGGHLLWTFDVLADLDNGKVLAGQKQVWLLDFHGELGNERLKLLLASFSRDRLNGSSYMQYFTTTYSCLPGSAQREGAIQVILPKARIEEEEFLLSMQIRTGGKPEGSVMILASDGTATIAYCNGGSIRLYQFDLAWDAGKVIDACVLSSSEESEEGSWLVLTEKAGVWAIPGKAVLLCGVEPPERSLSRKGSQNEGMGKDDRRRLALVNAPLLRSSPERAESGQLKETLAVSVPEQVSQNDEVEALVGHFFEDYIAAGFTDAVLEKLQQAGAFEKEGVANVFVVASKSIVDTLAKHWTSGMVTNAAVLAAVSSQLAEKQRRHQHFLQFLSASNCHEELRHRQRSALHLIMEHGEKLSAMIWLRDLHNRSAQARQRGSSPASVKSTVTDSGELGGAVWELVQLAGEKARRGNVMLLDRDKAEIFYSRVSDLEDLYSCAHEHIDVVVNKDQPIPLQVERICEIAHACSRALQTAIRHKDAQHMWYPPPEGLTPWYCKLAVRAGLWKVATLVLDLKEEAAVLVPSLVASLMSHLEGLADILLEAYAGALTAKVEREEEYRGLQMEYWSRRDALLGAMYNHAKGLLETAIEDMDDAEGEQKRLSVLQGLYTPLVSLARRHAGYQTLWDICTELNDTNLLRSLMHESMGLKEGRFSHFVFAQCYKNRQFSKLLRLGEEFRDELTMFLQNHKDLLWLHELYLQQFTLASSTVHWLALSKEPAVSATVEWLQGVPDNTCKVGPLTVPYRKRLLNLAKLSALAGGEVVSSEKTMEINADIEMMEIQDEAFRLGLVEEDDVLTPRQLVEVCLASDKRDLILRAFHAFAWGGDLFRRSNKSLLEAAWLKAADQDDWILMRQASERDGWSDEEHIEALRNTALYEVAKCCYSAEGVFGRGGSFHNVLPLVQEEMKEMEDYTDVAGVASVEAILMQHRDFAEAGEAMLAAVRMGSSRSVNFYDREVMEGMEV